MCSSDSKNITIIVWLTVTTKTSDIYSSVRWYERAAQWKDCSPSTKLMWAAFKSRRRRRRHMWNELVVCSLPCSEVFLFLALTQKSTLPNLFPVPIRFGLNTRTALNDSFRTLTCLVGKQIAVFFACAPVTGVYNLIPRVAGFEVRFCSHFSFSSSPS